MTMTKIIWMSDPHFQNEGTIDGLDPRARLAAAIDHMNAHHADAGFAVLSGDLVGDDVATDYRVMAPYLAASRVPIYPMMGNNDERAAFRGHLLVPDHCMEHFIQYTVETPESVFICLDTHKIGSHAGQLCAQRLAWLDEQLTIHKDKPVYIFMHHPPLSLGLPMQDQIMLEDADVFLDLLEAHGNVRHLFMGHVHRPTCGTVRGIPFATLGALSFQAPAPRPEWTWDSFAAAAEPPQYGVIEIADGNVVVQYTQFCRYETGVVD